MGEARGDAGGAGVMGLAGGGLVTLATLWGRFKCTLYWGR